MIAVIYMASNLFLVKDVLKIEKIDVEESIGRVDNAIKDIIRDLDAQTEDYASWDDTYNYILNGDEDYTKVNYIDDTFFRINISMVLILDKSGRILFEKAYDKWENTEIPVPENIKEQILKDKGLFLRNSGAEGSVKGLFAMPDITVVISSQPVLTSLGEGHPSGTLIMGRFLGEKEIEDLSSSFKTSFSIQRIHNTELPSQFTEARVALLNGRTSFIKPFTSETISGFRFIKDVYGENSLILRVDLPRSYFRQVRTSISTFVLLLIISAFIIGALILIMMERLVLFPVRLLCHNIYLIGESSDFSRRLPIKKRKDELSGLNESINNMLDELQLMHRKTQENELKFRALSEQNVLGMAVVLDGQVKYVNKALADILEYTVEEMLDWEPGKFPAVVNINNYDTLQEDVIDMKCSKEETVALYSHEIITRNMKVKWVELYCRIITYEGKDAHFIVIADITEKVQKDREIKYLNLHDKLTGVYNRACFEDQLKLVDKPGNYPISFIIGDVNGLKLTNDIFGRDEGDRHLRSLAEILKGCCRNNDVIARWGGDEFAVILPRTSNEEALSICEAITAECSKAGKDSTRPSISLGCATKENIHGDIQDILNEAEERMYRHKLLEGKSIRSSIISSLGKTLFEKSYETEEHAKRLLEISTKIGREIGLSGNELDELNLLSILHDIGKIAISESILAKAGELTSEEREKIKKHAEIGCRIAESSRELSHISKYILFHHERWDGTGYPQCLKGNAIPKLSRIISIVDAYDVMTHVRPYKKAISHSKAIEEIKRCAGTQFDPEMVKIFVKVMSKRQ